VHVLELTFVGTDSSCSLVVSVVGFERIPISLPDSDQHLESADLDPNLESAHPDPNLDSADPDPGTGSSY
jgi:hypothetical protein